MTQQKASGASNDVGMPDVGQDVSFGHSIPKQVAAHDTTLLQDLQFVGFRARNRY